MLGADLELPYSSAKDRHLGNLNLMLETHALLTMDLLYRTIPQTQKVETVIYHAMIKISYRLLHGFNITTRL